MLLYATVANVILCVTLLLHYTKHFAFKFVKRRQRTSLKQRTSTITNSINKDASILMKSNPINLQRYYCKCVAANDIELNFIPISFLFYIIFQLILCCLVMVVQMLDKNYTNHHLFPAGESRHSSNSVFSIHRLHIPNYNKYSFILNHLLIFGIMILSLWESLFTYYRFYSTFESARMQTVSTKHVLKRFSIYCIIFVILFNMQLYLYYWLWPLIVITHYSFNYYYTLKFSRLLIGECQKFEEIHMNKANDICVNNQNIIKNVRYMRKISLICCTSQSIALSAFVIIYNVNIIYCLPIVWSFSCFIFALNFVRNRRAIMECVRSCMKCQSENRNKVNISKNNVVSDNTSKKTDTNIAEAKHKEIPILLRRTQSELVPNVTFPIVSNLRRISLSNPIWKIKLISEKMDNVTPTLQPKTISAPVSVDLEQYNGKLFSPKCKLKAVESHGLILPTPPTPEIYAKDEEIIVDIMTEYDEYINKDYNYDANDDEGFVFTEDNIKSNKNDLEQRNNEYILEEALKPLERLAQIGFCSQTNFDLFANIVTGNHKLRQFEFWNGSAHTVHGTHISPPPKQLNLQNIRSTSDQ
eukprot:373752_1